MMRLLPHYCFDRFIVKTFWYILYANYPLIYLQIRRILIMQSFSALKPFSMTTIFAMSFLVSMLVASGTYAVLSAYVYVCMYVCRQCIGDMNKSIPIPSSQLQWEQYIPSSRTIREFIVEVRVRGLIQKGKTMVSPINCQHTPVCACVCYG